jgi:hypothetical protein
VDRVVLGIVAVLGIYDGIRLFGVKSFVPEPLGPGLYLLATSGLLLLALAIESIPHLFGTGRGKPAQTTQTSDASSVYGNSVLQAWLAMVFYAMLLGFVGYFLATLFFVVLSIWIFGERRLVWLAVSGGTMTLCLYLIFRKLAGIPLP